MVTRLPPEELGKAEDERARASERRHFFLGTTLILEGRPEVPARIRNLSSGGMMAEVAQEPDPQLAPGERVAAELRNIGRVRGEVAWTSGRRIGVKFDREIDPEAARQPVSAGPKTPDYAKALIVPDRALRPKGPPRR